MDFTLLIPSLPFHFSSQKLWHLYIICYKNKPIMKQRAMCN